MRLNFNTVSKTLLYLSSVVFFIACDKDFNTIGTDLVGENDFTMGKAYYDVFAYNRDLKAVRTDNLGAYRLGEYTDPVFGKNKAWVVSQLNMAANPTFGSFTQEREDNSSTDDNIQTIPENETVTKVYLNIPYFGSTLGDSDGDGAPNDIDPEPNTFNEDNDNDGVIDLLDSDDEDPDTDYDGDGLTDAEEVEKGTSPYLADTDYDGINDKDDEDTNVDNAPVKYELDSIFGNRNANFSVKLQEITYYLTDPNNNPNASHSVAPQYYSDFDFSPFTGALLGEESGLTIDEKEILIFDTEDDPETEDVDESLVPSERLSPRIRIELDPTFFQQKIIDMEGKDELASAANFRNYLRGVMLEIGVPSNDLLFMFNMAGANIQINYEYDSVNTNGTADDTSDDTIEKRESSITMTLSGKTVNLFEQDVYPSFIDSQLNGQNAENIVLNGGKGIYTEIKLFDEDDESIGNLEEARSKGWLINEANLVFHLNNEQLANYNDVTLPERLYLYDLDNSTPLLDYSNDFLSQTEKLVYGGVLKRDDDGKGVSYKFRITDHISRVLTKDSTNVKLGLVITPNIGIIANAGALREDNVEVKVPQANVINTLGTILYGSNVPADKQDMKLRLEIYYTDPQD